MDLYANRWGAERSSRISPSGTSHSAANILIYCWLLVCSMFSNPMAGCFCYGSVVRKSSPSLLALPHPPQAYSAVVTSKKKTSPLPRP
jgi:hypothetical protein